MCRLLLPSIALAALLAVTSCSSGADGLANNAPTAADSVAAQESANGSSAPESSDKANIELEANTSGRVFPCNLVDQSLLADVISEPMWDEEATSIRKNAESCTWGSGVDLGDEVTLVWSPNQFDTLKPAGTPVGGLGDSAFTMSNRVNDLEHDRLLGQTSMYVEFDEHQFLLQVRSEQPVFLAQQRLAASIIENCGSDCGPVKAEPSSKPALEDSACALISDEEVTSITGVVASGEISGTTSQGCGWNHKVTILEVDAERWADFQELENVVPVYEVGDEAFSRGEQLILMQDGQYWFVMSTSGTTQDKTIQQLSELGKLIASRM
ncbi:hypothetical protein [Specibacter sp. NPDC078709]|uniref:hypothetical protein n=1 Tax=unclassified Specibacter TaxID=3081321 RepID=UPI003439820D